IWIFSGRPVNEVTNVIVFACSLITAVPVTVPADESTTALPLSGLVNVCIAELASLKLSSAYRKKLSETTTLISTGIPQMPPEKASVKWSWNAATGFAASTAPGRASRTIRAVKTARTSLGRAMEGLLRSCRAARGRHEDRYEKKADSPWLPDVGHPHSPLGALF